MITSPAAVAAATVHTGALPSDLEGACRALEKEFANLVFRGMREAMVPKSGEGASGFAAESAQSLLDAEWARLATQGEGLGLWRAMLRQLDPDAVKSPSPGVEKEAKDAGFRREAGHEPERGARAPGLRAGRARPESAAPAHPGVPDVSEASGLPGADRAAPRRKGM